MSHLSFCRWAIRMLDCGAETCRIVIATWPRSDSAYSLTNWHNRIKIVNPATHHLFGLSAPVLRLIDLCYSAIVRVSRARNLRPQMGLSRFRRRCSGRQAGGPQCQEPIPISFGIPARSHRTGARGVEERLAHSGRGSYSGLDSNRWPNNAPRKTSTVAVPVQRREISTLCRESAFRVELETRPKVFKGATN